MLSNVNCIPPPLPPPTKSIRKYIHKKQLKSIHLNNDEIICFIIDVPIFRTDALKIHCNLLPFR